MVVRARLEVEAQAGDQTKHVTLALDRGDLLRFRVDVAQLGRRSGHALECAVLGAVLLGGLRRARLDLVHRGEAAVGQVAHDLQRLASSVPTSSPQPVARVARASGVDVTSGPSSTSRLPDDLQGSEPIDS
jgi:hypothetical protein